MRSNGLVDTTKISAAEMAALYDSVLLGMRDYIAKHEDCVTFIENTDLWDAAALYHALARAGVFEDPRAFNRFSLIVERALWQGSLSSDTDSTFAEMEMMLKRLGVRASPESILQRAINPTMMERR